MPDIIIPLPPKKEDGQEDKEKEIIVPVLPLPNNIVFPYQESIIGFGREKSKKTIQSAYVGARRVLVVMQKGDLNLEAKPENLEEIGVLCEVDRILAMDDEVSGLLRGIQRARVKEFVNTDPILVAKIELLSDVYIEDAETIALSNQITARFKQTVTSGKNVDFLNFMNIMSNTNHAKIADQVASTLSLKPNLRQDLINTLVVKERMVKVLLHLSEELKILEVERTISSKVQEKIDKNYKENILREKQKAIEKELGEDFDNKEMREFKDKIIAAKMPKDVEEKALRELKKFQQMSSYNPEAGYIRNYLEWLTDLPWSVQTPNHKNIKAAEDILNNDHFGLEKIKERILEYLSVMKLKSEKSVAKGEEKDLKVPTILCFIGPPGVGKTSIGKSIARALGRKFIKISLGGIRDEAEIRGHRRTYVGALPGRIIQGMKRADSKNPVFMLDEIDKVGEDFRGDPSAALLEALDPEQNSQFSDHYLEVDFDLSKVLFIATGNTTESIPAALLDRLETIPFAGYIDSEKFEIAMRYLVPKQIKINGLDDEKIEFASHAVRDIVRKYTREAGVRNLEREIAKACRRVAKLFASGATKKQVVTDKNLHSFLGPRKFIDTIAEKKDEIGVSTGLAYTQAGGDILFIEVALMPGKGNLTLTGQLGDVMKESAQAAWSYVRSRWKQLGMKENFYTKLDVHIHVPEGAVPKDGPSAGIAIATALSSALMKKPTNRFIGMTGEITLRGSVLEIGGLKEKLVAAHRAGLKEIILPKNNKKDLEEDVPKYVLKDLKFHFVEKMDQVLPLAIKNFSTLKKKNGKK